MMNLETPLRTPDTSSQPLMAKRGWWLVVIGCFLPGSAQVFAGNRKLGRLGHVATLVLIGGAAVAAGVYFVSPTTLFTFFTNSLVLLVVEVLLLAYGLLWLVLGLNTLALTKLVKVRPGSRVAIAIVSVFLTVLPAAGAAWAATIVDSSRGAISSIFGGGAPAVAPVDGRYNILLLGGDAGEDREGLRPDSISLISVDAKTGQSLVIGVPRDLLYAPFPEESPMHALYPDGYGVYGCNVDVCLMNSIYTEVELNSPELYPQADAQGSSPGIEATKDAVSGVTGLDVQFFVMVDMVGFESLINALGGVDINVQERLPIGGDAWGNGVEGYVEAGQQHMDGYTALWYARSRYSTDDYDRMRRQRELQSAILAQMNPQNVLLRFQQVASAGASIVTTDIPESMLGRFVELATKAQAHSPVNVELTPPNVIPEDPDYFVISELVQEGLRAASPQPEEAQ